MLRQRYPHGSKMFPDRGAAIRDPVNGSKISGLRNFALRKKPKKPKTLDEVKEDFRHNTTLLGIQHILQRKSILWTLAYICCVGMSIYQSWAVTLDFIMQRTHQKYSIQNIKVLPFPSVTVCNGVVLPGDYDLSSIPNYDTTLEPILNASTCSNPAAIEAWEAAMDNNTRAILKHRRRMNESERMALSGSVGSFITTCKFDGSRCEEFNNTEEFLIFNNPYFGSCVTFNPGFHSTVKEKDVHAKLYMELKLHKNTMQLDTRYSRAGVLIHAPGTAPVLTMAAVQDIYDQQAVSFTLRLVMKEFMARRTDATTMSCIDHKDIAYRKKSRYYSKDSNYFYSVKACMKTCEEKYMQRDCKMNDATAPASNNDEERIREASDYSPYMSTDVCEIHEDIDMTMCDCPLPCNYTQYSVALDTAELQSPVCEKLNGSKEEVPGSAEIMVYFISNIFEKVEEELTISLSQFLGILGGNMSLWIGMCIISMLELFELSFNLLRAWLNKRKLDNTQQTENTSKILTPSYDQHKYPKTKSQFYYIHR